ncbi:hypothetical protein BKA69DRAFT_52177 [Paraphysoderma sedebokerense]|nr:hypothetical protein BKA69DRAFT_52177 [Paraphysoderma sedebokerense]
MLATHFEGASKGQYLLNAETALKLYQESTRFIQHMLNHIRAASAGTPALKQQLMQLQSQIAQSKEGSIPASSATSTTSTSVANAQASSPPSTQLSLAKSPPSSNFALPQKPQPTNQKSIPNSSTSPPQQQVQLKGPSIGASANPMVPTTSSVAKPQLSGQQSTQIKPISSLRGGKPPPSSKTPNKPPQMYFLEHIQYLAMSNQGNQLDTFCSNIMLLLSLSIISVVFVFFCLKMFEFQLNVDTYIR